MFHLYYTKLLVLLFSRLKDSHFATVPSFYRIYTPIFTSFKPFYYFFDRKLLETTQVKTSTYKVIMYTQSNVQTTVCSQHSRYTDNTTSMVAMVS